jgi:hypothetical protein
MVDQIRAIPTLIHKEIFMDQCWWEAGLTDIFT